MTIKEELAVLLEENRGHYISGAEIAKRLYCTRGAVWKAINALRADGYKIDAVTNRGYCLAEGDVLDEASVRRYLKAEGIKLTVLKTVDSTNAYLRVLAQGGAPEGTAVISGGQTNGCGRRGRSFYSPADTGLYLSILLRPDFPAQDAVQITTAAAAAVCLAIEDISPLKPEIKWVNDIYLDGKKVGGILTEASLGLESGLLDYAVVGIGINVLQPAGGFPKELHGIAGAVFQTAETDLRSRLAGCIINRFMDFYHKLPDRAYLEDYRKRLIWRGEKIYVISGANSSERTPAEMIDIDESCRLIVRYENGETDCISSGEISIRK